MVGISEEERMAGEYAIMANVRNALLPFGGFGTDNDSKDILFFNTERMVTCELEFTDASYETKTTALRCSTSVGLYKMNKVFTPNSPAEDYTAFGMEVLRWLVRAAEDFATERTKKSIRMALGID